MADYVVTSTADSGSGSLRTAISTATNGDTIIFDTATFPANVETSILLSSPIAISKNINIDALHDANGDAISGATWTNNGVFKTRVVIDLQASTTVRALTYTGNEQTNALSGITFQNGAAQAGGAIQFRYGSNTINYCVFKNFSCTGTSACISAYGTSQNVFNNCVFKDLTATEAGAAFYIYGNNGCVTTLNNCEFNTCISTATNGNGGAIRTYQSVSVILNSCTFTNCAATNGASINIDTNVSATINDCTFNTTTGNSNINAANTATPLIIKGLNTVDKIKLISGALVIFDGVDTILAVKTTFTYNGATFATTNDSTGYLAIPDGTTPPTVGTNIKIASYTGAVTAISSTVSERTATLAVTNSTAISPLIEYRSSGDTGAWTTLNVVDNQATIGDDRAFKVRAFDGAKFTEGTTVPRTYYYQGSASSGSFGTASDWAMDKNKTMTCNATPTITGGTFRL